MYFKQNKLKKFLGFFQFTEMLPRYCREYRDGVHKGPSQVASSVSVVRGPQREANVGTLLGTKAGTSYALPQCPPFPSPFSIPGSHLESHMILSCLILVPRGCSLCQFRPCF